MARRTRRTRARTSSTSANTGIGKLANSLKLGCDCLGAIQYLDCWMAGIDGEPMVIENGICIHEEDHGILWKHFDIRLETTEVRRARRLVISSISTVGNYEYGSYWYFYLDGEIEFEMKATGIINTVGCEPGRGANTGPRSPPASSARSTSTSSARGSTSPSMATGTPSTNATRWPSRRGRKTPTATPSSCARRSWRPKAGASATPTRSATGSSPAPSGPTPWASRPPTSWSRPTASRPSTTRRARPASAWASSTISSGSRRSTRRSASPRAIRQRQRTGARGCRPS